MECAGRPESDSNDGQAGPSAIRRVASERQLSRLKRRIKVTCYERVGRPRSATIFSETRQELAMMVKVGLAPVPVGNGEPSTT